jgi:hypothetical protein
MSSFDIATFAEEDVALQMMTLLVWLELDEAE